MAILPKNNFLRGPSKRERVSSSFALVSEQSGIDGFFGLGTLEKSSPFQSENQIISKTLLFDQVPQFIKVIFNPNNMVESFAIYQLDVFGR